MTENKELAVINAQNAVQVFTGGGMKALLDQIESRVRAISLDASTASGREEIRSTAYRVARTKTALDAEGKRLTEGWREATKKVNEERKLASERLDALADEVRKPLTDYENHEKARVAAHEAALRDITGLQEMIKLYPDMRADLLEEHLYNLRNSFPDQNWEEFAGRAKSARAEAESYIIRRLADRRKYEAEQAELERLRREDLERRARERDERLKAEAADAARLAAERKAKTEADAEARRVIEAAEEERKRVWAEAARIRNENERQRKDAEDKARTEKETLEAHARAIEQKRQSEELLRIAAEKRAKDAEIARKAAQEKAERDLKAAQDKAEREKQAAIQRERERVAREQKVAEEVRLKRETDEANRAKVRSEIVNDLAHTAPQADWYAIADALIAGKIRHIKVEF